MTAVEFNHQLVGLEKNLSRFALSLTSDPDDAQDLVQETFLKALSNRDKFVEYTSLKAWTFTIMKNTFINNYRKAVRENTSVDNTKDSFYLNSSKQAAQENPDTIYSTGEITKQIEKLTDEFKVPFKMHTEGYKYKEIADKLGLKIGTVKSRIFFTRKKLMDSLHDYAA
ncbi:MAG: sigma-70 family RNA polymerase sigma factor [Bacteroidales bacterium]|nr:sigma-70 family RNA polymerase sigma factor [Bacteroidales bacterium]